MADSPLQNAQLAMTRYLRDPERESPPAGVEARRLTIYADLVYNNIEGFISGGFPVLRSLYSTATWQALVREFIRRHRCRTPYFLEISQEFVRFLMDEPVEQGDSLPFLAELAHYEWVELALDTACEELPAAVPAGDVLTAVLQLSPLAWLLRYRFPVHRIGPGFRPVEAAEPTYLVVYRNRADDVCFMELNATTARLLELLRDNTTQAAGDVLRLLARESGIAEEAVLGFGAAQLHDLIERAVVLVHTL